jgi:polysaccharide biosynthesis/export protein
VLSVPAAPIVPSRRSWRLRVRLFGLLSGLAFASVGCANYGSYVWFSQIPASAMPPASGYVLKAGDAIVVRVYGQDSMTSPTKIRSDGRISLLLVGELVASGKQPTQLAAEIAERLKVFMVTPQVTVSVEQSAPITVTLLGEVKSPGNQTLESPATLVQVLAQSGGLSEYADDKAIFVLRRSPAQQRIRFTYDAVLANEHGAAAFPMQSGDVIVVQ